MEARVHLKLANFTYFGVVVVGLGGVAIARLRATRLE
jgi:hypothetical protein